MGRPKTRLKKANFLTSVSFFSLLYWEINFFLADFPSHSFPSSSEQWNSHIFLHRFHPNILPPFQTHSLLRMGMFIWYYSSVFFCPCISRVLSGTILILCYAMIYRNPEKERKLCFEETFNIEFMIEGTLRSANKSHLENHPYAASLEVKSSQKVSSRVTPVLEMSNPIYIKLDTLDDNIFL